jgi:4,5-DOPA dioxygenase extradiol
MTTQDFKNFNQALPLLDYTMPALFIGHGSPMNGIEDNDFSQRWQELAKEIPVPTAVIVISAHWFTKGTRITAMEHPETIHDFGGFPKELFSVQYPAPGSPSLAQETASMIQTTTIDLAHDWGLDHGTWTVVRHMYPEAKIPVLQLSIDYTKAPQYHYDLAKELTALRKKGVLIIGSGNMVHNLRLMSWDMIKSELGYDWANEMNSTFKNLIVNKEHDRLIQYEKLGKEAMMAIPTPEHYLPLIYSLALQGKSEEVSFFNDKAVGGSLTMTSVKIGS